MPLARRARALLPPSIVVALAFGLLVALQPSAASAQRRAAPRAEAPKAAKPATPKPGAGVFPLSTLWMMTLDTPPAMAAYDDSRAYILLKPDPDGGFPQPRLTAISLTNGSTKWTRQVEPIDALAAGGGQVFVAAGPVVRALGSADGAERWQVTLPAPLSAPVHVAGDRLIAATQSSDVLVVRADDGAKLWQLHLPSPATGEPAAIDEALYLPLTDNRVLRLNSDTGAVVWDRTIRSQPRMILALDDRVFVGTREYWFYALRPSDGRVLWHERVGSAVTGFPIADSARVYFLALDNLLRALERSGGSLKWRRMLPRRATFGPLRVEDVLLVAGASPTIQAYDTGGGAPAGSFDAPHDLAGPPHVVPGLLASDFLLIVLTGEGELMALRPQSLEPERFVPSPGVYLITGFPVWKY